MWKIQSRLKNTLINKNIYRLINPKIYHTDSDYKKDQISNFVFILFKFSIQLLDLEIEGQLHFY
jgi:hypothetical protein